MAGGLAAMPADPRLLAGKLAASLCSRAEQAPRQCYCCRCLWHPLCWHMARQVQPGHWRLPTWSRPMDLQCKAMGVLRV